MTGETLFVFGLLLVTVILFASDRLRLDVVAMLVIGALLLSGLLSPREALAGFGDPVVLLIAGLFVVGESLLRTGVAYAVGNWLMRVAGTSPTRLLVLLMLTVAALSAFMSSTGAVDSRLRTASRHLKSRSRAPRRSRTCSTPSTD